ncbi:MAG: hypothetical protein GVY29_09110 [Spirochaetes bacterium]|jgi:hypothetical protein|nr:hypothetical protein [Spirochaetota bacterium]
MRPKTLPTTKVKAATTIISRVVRFGPVAVVRFAEDFFEADLERPPRVVFLGEFVLRFCAT